MTGEIATFNVPHQRDFHPASVTLDDKKYKGLKIDNKKVGDSVTFLIKGNITEIGELFDDKEHMRMSIDIEIIEDHTIRSDLDNDRRVR